MDRSPHSRVSLLVYLLGLAALGVGMAQWLDKPDPAPTPTPTPPTFHRVDQAPAARPAAQAPAMPMSAITPATAVAVELVDVVSVPRGRPRAMLRINGGSPLPFVWGDMVSVGVRLSRVLPNGVELQRGKDVEFLPLAASAFSRTMPVTESVSARGANAAQPLDKGVEDSSVITRPADQPPPSSNAVDRAIRRATAS